MATAPDLLGPSALPAPSFPAPVISGGSGKRWFVLQSKPREETVCRDELGRGGIEAFCPLVREFRVRRKRYETVPLFPGYVFARFAYPDQFHEVLWKRGVSRIVQFGEALPFLDDEVVDFFRRRNNPEGFIEKGPEFKPGDSVERRSGQLKPRASRGTGPLPPCPRRPAPG